MTMLDDDTIKPYCPSLLRGKSDKIKLSQILREMRLSDLCQMKRFRRPRKGSLHTLLTNLSNASWYSHFEAEYICALRTLIEGVDSSEARRRKIYWDGPREDIMNFLFNSTQVDEDRME